MVLDNSNDLAKITPGNNQLLEMVQLLKDIKSMFAIREEPAVDISSHIIQELRSVLENRPITTPSKPNLDKLKQLLSKKSEIK
ncbi:hypothetical protein PCASD_24291 [Puccinia coronata f. sp. avenae]|uniref:Uncharacterized protein n=1 Tax=Puccinia coronata f. sp. avenae TaxID=200324 RepID=A0A2N5TU82_9BASI|nr:hypothetical protein PCASD_24291 [Puccinia coronata f. sp. avenae]